MKKITFIPVITIILILLTGCAECISTTESSIHAKVVDSYYQPAYNTTIINPALHTISVVPHPAIYRIPVEYDDCEYDIEPSSAYKKYHKKIVEYVNATLETNKCDDGTVRYDIISLE